MVSLSTLGIAVTEDIVVQNLEEKVQKVTKDKWTEKIITGSFHKLVQMIDFLYETTKLLSKQADHTDDSSTQPQKCQKFLATSTIKIEKNTPINCQTFLSNAHYKCKICSRKPHPLYKSKKFYSPTSTHVYSLRKFVALFNLSTCA